MTPVRTALTAVMRPTGLLILPALAALPVLLFSAFVPPWLPPVAAALVAAVGALAAWRGRRMLGHTPADWPLLLLLLTLPVGLWASADRSATLPRTYAFVADIAIFYIVTALAAALPAARWPRWAAWALILGGLALAAAFLLGTQFATNKLPFIDRRVYQALPGGLRPFWNPRGFSPNLAGGLLGMFLPPALMLALHARGWPLRIVAGAASLILAAMMVLAQSRGALIGAAVALPLITVLADRRWLFVWAAVVVAILVALALPGSPGPADLQNLVNAALGGNGTLSEAGFSGRVELWSRALYIIQDFPFTGVGMGMFEPVVRLLYPLFSIGPDVQFEHAHNIFLQAGLEMGLPGLIGHLALYMVLGALLARQAWASRAARRGDQPRPLTAVLALGLLGALTVFLVHGLFDLLTYATRAAIVIWALFGLMLAVGLASHETG
ncbi:MAG: O-Antigen ligase [Chloroflexi bacterium ADurb.Bin325]|nr:MAG: O-Antigen ligase [Chloroflexi bacterium ADurb.Bin325]